MRVVQFVELTKRFELSFVVFVVVLVFDVFVMIEFSNLFLKNVVEGRAARVQFQFGQMLLLHSSQFFDIASKTFRQLSLIEEKKVQRAAKFVVLLQINRFQRLESSVKFGRSEFDLKAKR